MKRRLWLIAIAALLGACGDSNVATCILDEMPEVQNDMAAGAVMQSCLTRNPDGFQGVVPGSGRGWLSYDSGAECAAEKSRYTGSNLGARFIRGACEQLYTLPTATSFDASTARPAQ